MFVRKRGSLATLKTALGRRNVPKKPSSNFNESEDFIEVVTQGHIVEAFLQFAGMESVDSDPSEMTFLLAGTQTRTLTSK